LINRHQFILGQRFTIDCHRFTSAVPRLSRESTPTSRRFSGVLRPVASYEFQLLLVRF